MVDMSMIKDKLSHGEIDQVRWVDKTKQLADCLTKKQASSEKLRSVLQQGRMLIDC